MIGVANDLYGQHFSKTENLNSGSPSLPSLF